MMDGAEQAAVPIMFPQVFVILHIGVALQSVSVNLPERRCRDGTQSCASAKIPESFPWVVHSISRIASEP